MKNSYHFSAKPWQFSGKGGWIFVSFPKEISIEIRLAFKEYEEGWGRLKCEARIGNTTWNTSIWFDAKQNTYLLPLKNQIRIKEKIILDKIIDVMIMI